jgi:hypothetical protein
MHFPNFDSIQYVYFITAPEVGRVKIGLTTGYPGRRLAALQTGSPCRLHLATYIPTDDCQRLEKDLHNKFARYRLYGEWFSLEGELKEFVENGGGGDINLESEELQKLPECPKYPHPFGYKKVIERIDNHWKLTKH